MQKGNLGEKKRGSKHNNTEWLKWIQVIIGPKYCVCIYRATFSRIRSYKNIRLIDGVVLWQVKCKLYKEHRRRPNHLLLAPVNFLLLIDHDFSCFCSKAQMWIGYENSRGSNEVRLIPDWILLHAHLTLSKQQISNSISLVDIRVDDTVWLSDSCSLIHHIIKCRREPTNRNF